VYDYFVKDHLGNTRMVLSEEEQLDAYPAATMELSQASVETALYSNVEGTRSAKPAGYPADTYTDPNNYVAKLNGNGNKVGPGIVLKVMSGDRVNIRASSWYYLNGADPGTPVNPLNDLLNVLATGVTTVVTDYGKFTRTDLISNGILSPGVGSMLDQQTASYSNSTKPKAYLSWILLDEQFRLVSSSSGFEQVGADGELKTWVKTNLPINRNGYLYVYTSNESPVDVFFDNLQVSHIRGPLLEETHYYPFGLTMAGISSKAAGKLENRYKYNGIELDTTFGLNEYEAHFRDLDPALGRWWQIDPKIEGQESESPYSSMANNPILKSDPLGDEPITSNEGDVKGVINKAADYAMAGVRWFNANLNPLASVVEAVTGKSVESDFTVDKSRAVAGMEAAISLIPGAKIEGAIIKTVESVAEKTVIKTSVGTEIKGFTKHGVNRAIERGVRTSSIHDAIKNPLKVGNVVTDKAGKESQRYIGRTAEAVVNPKTGKIVSVNPTSTKKAAALIKKAGEQ